MLQLNKITKTYITGDLKQDALKEVSVSFRDCEFVSILGHSGSGKTTLLNIIGGLDQYTDGDLIINGISTKKYKDKDWDAYRNHDIGFVFQSYNLIPHQTVLANVELALTLSGVSKAEREEKAKEALKKVGLEEHIHKKPNQLSGGQMQRVAIARALVNDPHILLADEPTGALDSETSVQIMNLLQEISKDKLVIMVTHNPELAYKYSTRIIKLSDGRIIDDSMPYEEKDEIIEKPSKVKNASMSFFTALSLSLDNLLTKKVRTFMTSFAGSIGIMGIALILSVSTGFQKYIDYIEENTLTSYPLTIYSETTDAASAVLSMVSDNDKQETDTDVVKEKKYISKMFESIGKNDLKSFKVYLDENKDEVDEICSSIIYKYNVTPMIYGTDVTNNIVCLNPSNMYAMMGYSSKTMMSSAGIFNEMIDDYELLNESYDMLAGHWPENYNEMVVVLSEPNGISDLLAYSLGLKDTAKLKELMQNALTGQKTEDTDTLELTYDDLLNLEFKLIDPTSLYKYNSKYDIYEDMTDDKEYLKNVYDNAEDLKIVGIVCLKSSSNSMALYPGVGYSSELTKHVMETAENSEIVKKQLENKTIDVFSNQPFEQQKDNEINFNDMITVDSNMLNSAFGLNTDLSTIDPQLIAQLVEKYGKALSEGVITDTSVARKDLDDLLAKLCLECYEDYCTYRKDEQGKVSFDIESAQEYAQIYVESGAYKTEIDSINKKYNAANDLIKEEFDKLINSFLVASVQTLNFNSPQDYDVALSYSQSCVDLFVSTIMSDENDKFDGIAQYLTACKIGETVENNSKDLSKQFTKDVAEIFGKDLIVVDSSKLTAAFKFNMTQQDLSRLMEAMMTSSETKTYQSNLSSLGYQDENEPTYISFYFRDFNSKQRLKDFIDEYNQKQIDDEKKISYTDMTGILMSSVETIINAVTYVLIAFVSISLVVSTIMIGVITLISVMERTKEIGILRAIGASKRDVGNVFNAETFIIGLLSGLIGIAGSELLLIPINKILYHLTDIQELKAVLPKESCLILILISVVLTLISGLIPARNASRKNPVEALRTE